MDTILFLLLLATWVVIMRVNDRARALTWFAVSFVAVLLLFQHHVTGSLDLNF